MVGMTESLVWLPTAEHPELLGAPVAAALSTLGGDVDVAAIHPELADTDAFCSTYDVRPEDSGNCVLITGRRGGGDRYAACLVLATTRADVNGVARRLLDVRKASFVRLEDAVSRSGMEYGGITPLGLPPDWPVYLDTAVATHPRIIIGSGIRGSKLALPGRLLAGLATAQTVDGLGR